jgi:hypothetical protein
MTFWGLNPNNCAIYGAIFRSVFALVTCLLVMSVLTAYRRLPVGCHVSAEL